MVYISGVTLHSPVGFLVIQLGKQLLEKQILKIIPVILLMELYQFLSM